MSVADNPLYFRGTNMTFWWENTAPFAQLAAICNDYVHATKYFSTGSGCITRNIAGPR
jgi:hypothetical protein